VQRVERGTQAVRLTGVGFELTAKRAVITIPPPLVMNIHFSPALEPERARLIAAFRMGSVFKAIVVYARPFWRDGRSNGQLWQASGPLAGTYDITPENSAHGVLAVLSAASAAEALHRQAPAERRATVLAAVAQHFGSAAQSPLHYAERCWSEEPWSGGGYAAYLGPGHFAHGMAALRSPCGHLHWAGTETALEWPGYMEGALESAERVLAELSNPAP